MNETLWAQLEHAMAGSFPKRQERKRQQISAKHPGSEWYGNRVFDVYEVGVKFRCLRVCACQVRGYIS